MRTILLIMAAVLLAGCSRKASETVMAERTDTARSVSTLHTAVASDGLRQDSAWTLTLRTLTLREKETLTIGEHGDTLRRCREREMTGTEESRAGQTACAREAARLTAQTADSVTSRTSSIIRHSAEERKAVGRGSMKPSVTILIGLLAGIATMIALFRSK